MGIFYLAGISSIIVLVTIDKFCEVYGFKNAVGPIKIILPFAGIIGALAGLWVITS